MTADPLSSSALFRDWACAAAFPLWATRGFDHRAGRFEERLSLSAERCLHVPIRLMSQARQIHSYALAARGSWYADGLALVEHAYGSMVRDFYRADGNEGWIFSIKPDGAPADTKRDLYSHAFALLAVASYAGATGKAQALTLADETLAFLERQMASPEGGFVEQLPAGGHVRRQNPHMHLLEALLALWECSGDHRYLDRAHRLVDLFASRFFREDCGALGEYYTASLAPAEGVRGQLVEPGHHYEWIWLLRRFEVAAGLALDRYTEALYAHAERHGFDEEGLIVDEVLAEGGHHRRSRRIWPITEAIKANLLQAARGRADCITKAARLTGLLCDRFLLNDPAGGWVDRLDAKGRCASEFMPASTLYHLAGALDEWGRFQAR
ncbi:MAG: AGE family epimerase/isomerase [Alphaproteobacteria bacterium]|nr:AGE family epimerase/isomerase [Alphaproteobacteria bacterium]MBV8407507.1 AGE family epimerase/isomerase [Alphaproteobacteria bacterium]